MNEQNDEPKLADIVKSSPNKTQGFLQFGKMMGARHSKESALAATVCGVCGEAHPSRLVMLNWKAVYHDVRTGIYSILMLLVGRVTSAHKHVVFSTFHPVCNQCNGAITKRSLLIGLIKGICFPLLIIGLLIAIPTTAITVVLVWQKQSEPKIIGACILALAALGVVVYGLVFAAKNGTPKLLRNIGQYPFELSKKTKLKEKGPGWASRVRSKY